MNDSYVRRAFTLVELLVVITIIAMLAAVLFPVFAAARRRATQSTCLSNQRQIGMALLQYAADYDETWWHGSGLTSWSRDAAFARIKNVAVFRCPDDPTEDEQRHLPLPLGNEVAYAVSYALNSNVQTQTVADIASPSRTVMLFESINCTETLLANHRYAYGSSSGNGGRSMYCMGVENSSCKLLEETAPDMPLYATGRIGGRNVNGNLTLSNPRHTTGANYVAMDGHALWLQPERVSGGDSQPTGGAQCAQDDAMPPCAPKPSAAGTENRAYGLTFSIH